MKNVLNYELKILKIQNKVEINSIKTQESQFFKTDHLSFQQNPILGWLGLQSEGISWTNIENKVSRTIPIMAKNCIFSHISGKTGRHIMRTP